MYIDLFGVDTLEIGQNMIFEYLTCSRFSIDYIDRVSQNDRSWHRCVIEGVRGWISSIQWGSILSNLTCLLIEWDRIFKYRTSNLTITCKHKSVMGMNSGGCIGGF